MKVGTRELKNRLSHYLKQVKNTGESLYVTERGTVVAELRPVRETRESKRAEEQALARMAARGDLTNGKGHFRDVKPIKVKPGKPLSRILLEERR